LSIPYEPLQRSSLPSTIRRFAANLLDHGIEQMKKELEYERRWLRKGRSFIYSSTVTAATDRRERLSPLTPGTLRPTCVHALSEEEVAMLHTLLEEVMLYARNRPVIAVLQRVQRMRNRLRWERPLPVSFSAIHDDIRRLEDLIGPRDLQQLLRAL
jgi:hypothetical protein